MKTMCKRILTMVLALLLAAAFPVSVAADVWIPPDDNVNETLLMSPYFQNDCKALNAFVSNYVEANLREFDSSTTDSVAIAVTLKHLELNEGLFGNEVTGFVDEDGTYCMKVSASTFEARMWKLFARDISARECPGYEDGYIYVSAENFGGPIRVFGSVEYINYIGNGVYDLAFTVYYVPQGVSDEYSIPYMDIAERGYQELGTGYAVLYFNDTQKTSFRTADFRLMDFWMDAEGIPCTAPNRPMECKSQSSQSSQSTEAPTEAPTEEPTQPPETEPEVTQTQPVQTEQEPTETRRQEQPQRDQSVIPVRNNGNNMILLIVLAVMAVALLAAAVILLVFRRKE